MYRLKAVVRSTLRLTPAMTVRLSKAAGQLTGQFKLLAWHERMAASAAPISFPHATVQGNALRTIHARPLRMSFSEILEVKVEAFRGDFIGDRFAAKAAVVRRGNAV